MSTRSCLLLAALAAPASAAPATQPIIDGIEAHADTAVVGLSSKLGTIYCSGTLISPRIVLTAAHCVYNRAPPERIFVGRDPSVDGVFVPVESARAHPDFSRTANAADVGIVVLARPLPITPVPLIERAIASKDATADARFVGFGVTESGDGSEGIVGVKFTREAPLRAVEEHWLVYADVACHGDSGGPTLFASPTGPVIAGVVSHGDAACRSTGYSTRVDLYAAWIAAQVAELDTPSCQLDQRCAAGCTSDPDCAVAVATPDAPGGCSTTRAASPWLLVLVLALLLRRRRVALAALLVAGCAMETEPEGRALCDTRPIGDPGKPIEVDVVTRDVGPLALTVQATNLDGCAVAIAMQVRDAAGEVAYHAGTIVELDASGAVDPRTPSNFLELPAERSGSVTILVEDASRRWSAVLWTE